MLKKGFSIMFIALFNWLVTSSLASTTEKFQGTIFFSCTIYPDSVIKNVTKGKYTH